MKNARFKFTFEIVLDGIKWIEKVLDVTDQFSIKRGDKQRQE